MGVCEPGFWRFEDFKCSERWRQGGSSSSLNAMLSGNRDLFWFFNNYLKFSLFIRHIISLKKYYWLIELARVQYTYFWSFSLNYPRYSTTPIISRTWSCSNRGQILEWHQWLILNFKTPKNFNQMKYIEHSYQLVIRQLCVLSAL